MVRETLLSAEFTCRILGRPRLNVVEFTRLILCASLMTPSPHDAVCPEKRLLVCCARTRMLPPMADEIRALVAGPLDWNFALSAAAENSIGLLLGRQICACAEDLVAPAQLARLKNVIRGGVVRSMALTAELIRVVDALQARGVQAIPYKGPILSAQAYGDVALREFEDLDIVLGQRDMAKANDILAGLGLRPKYPWNLSQEGAKSPVPGEYQYSDDSRRLFVELHTEATLRHFPAPPDLDELAGRLQSVNLGGQQLRTFGPEDMLPILCVHGSKDFWARISWIADVSEFVQSQPRLDWDRVFRNTQLRGTQRMLYLGLALAAGLLGTPLPAAVASRMESDAVAMSLARQIERAHLSHDWPKMSAAWRFRYRRKMLSNTLNGWRYAVRLTLVPADDDYWGSVRLPHRLAPLYVALRPFRLLRKYGVRG